MAAAAMRASVVLFLDAAVIVGCSVSGAMAANLNDPDFDTELHERQAFHNKDFVYKFEKVTGKTPYGNLRPMTVDLNNALATLPGEGASQNLVTIGPCAVNQPRSHPRATEISHVTEVWRNLWSRNFASPTVTQEPKVKAFFNLPIQTIRATTGLADSDILKINASITANPNPSLDKMCARHCGIHITS